MLGRRRSVLAAARLLACTVSGYKYPTDTHAPTLTTHNTNFGRGKCSEAVHRLALHIRECCLPANPYASCPDMSSWACVVQQALHAASRSTADAHKDGACRLIQPCSAATHHLIPCMGCHRWFPFVVSKQNGSLQSLTLTG